MLGGRAAGAAGAKLRVQLLARDLIVATQMPQQLSVRNNLTGVVTAVTGDEGDSDLIAIDIGGTIIMARVTRRRRASSSSRRAARMGAGEVGVAARHSFATRVPRCMMATM